MSTEKILSGVKVLVADDSNTIRRSADIFLRKAGCEVVYGEDGFDALAKIPDFKPDLIFVDVMMPKLDGYQVCAVVKQHPRFRALPVIMLTSKDNVFDRARAKLLGADEYLTKPFTRDSLLNAVARYAFRAAP
ncbi:MAG: Alkaline phosphatase synthesis transcriptional regulatory protein PhoP [Chromatiales bacterium USCg_Taylor]|jgi:twitching motility two-component system response regulator PilG|nr:MAG: Alkaline phosphatase synthesis transcriptional regulatory protein PhoP [Chromatiales bacterium USCg_Taylor]